MRTLVIATLLLSIVLIESTFGVTQSLRSGGYFCGTDGSCLFEKPGDPNWLFQRFTYAMGYADCPTWIGIWRLRSPQCRLILYTSGTDLPPHKSIITYIYNGTRKATWIRNRMTQLGELEEKAYMHFYNDTRIRIWNGSAYDTILIPGTNSMTIAAKDSVSRVPNSYVTALASSGNTYSGETRLAPNFTNAKLRQAYKEYLTQIFNTDGDVVHWPGKTGYWDGVYFDNYSPLGLQGSGLASGGLIVETGTSPGNLLTFASDAYGSWGWGWMQTFGRAVRDTLQMADAWAVDHKKKILAYNIGISHKNSYLFPDSSGADALNGEFAFDPVYCNNSSYHRLENLFTRDSIAARNGATFFWCSVPWTSYGTGNTTKRNAIYNNLCFYYAARSDSTWFFARPDPGNAYGVFYNPGFDTLAWVPAMGYELGTPTGHYQLATSGASTDESGATYKVWYRDYQNGRVFIRPRDGFDAKWGATSTPVTVSLGGSYQKLNIDGTLGSAVTSIQLAGAEGAIMIPASSGGCSTPPSVPTLNSPANGTTTTTMTPSLCVNNSTQGGGCSQPIRYHFQVSLASNFSSIAAENSNVPQGTSPTCWTVSPALLAGRTYYWRARAGNGTTWSNWSATRNFITPNTAPSTPTPNAPANGTTVSSTQPTLVVNNSTDAEGGTLTYHYQVSLVSNFSTIAREATSVPQGSTTTSWQVTPALTNLTTYYWRVRCYDGALYSGWSTVRSFYVNQANPNQPPTAPTRNSPADGYQTTDITPDLKINNSTDPNGDVLNYQFEVYDSTSTTLIVQSPMVAQSGSGITTWTVSTNLTSNRKYTWRARAFDSQAWSGWMNWANFRVITQSQYPPTMPVPITPVDGDTVIGSFHVLVTNNSTDPNGDILTYDFRVCSDSILTKNVEVGTSIPQSNPYTFFFTGYAYEEHKAYWWTVRAYDGTSWTNWCTAEKFWHFDLILDAEDAPSLVAPADGSTESNVRPKFHISWSGDADSSVCFFEMATSFDFAALFDAGTVLGFDGKAEWLPNRELENDQVYYWRARREKSGYSDVFNLTVAAPVFVSPNPFSYLDRTMTLHNLPDGSVFEVYTPSGDRVVRVENLKGNYEWNVLNDSGEKLASGVYLYYVTAGGQKSADKFIVVR